MSASADQGTVDDAEISRFLQQNADPKFACDKLVERAIEHGGRDNVTVVLAGYAIPSESPH